MSLAEELAASSDIVTNDWDLLTVPAKMCKYHATDQGVNFRE
jgi:hypothetical protein